MEKIWFCSDLHFGHSRPFLYEPRGFDNISSHDRAIIDNWNSVINWNDNIYILGDLMLNDDDHGLSCIKQLNGNIHIIRGNHDSAKRMELYQDLWNVVEVCEGKYFRYKKYHFYLSHYPCLTSNHDDDKPLKARMISLCGHTHTKDKFQDWDKGTIYHCELDAHNMFPVDIETIIEDLKRRFQNDKAKN